MNGTYEKVRRSARLHRSIWRFGAVVVVAASVVIAVASTSLAGHRSAFGAWAPGRAGAVSAISANPVVAPSPALSRLVSETAVQAGGNATSALSSLQELQSNLGVGDVSLYSFSPGEGALCLVVWHRSVICPTATQNPTPGVLWIFDGGYTKAVSGSPGQAPPALVGLVDDNVASVSALINGTATPIPVIDNTFFYEVTPPAADSAWSVGLQITYKDGSTSVANLGDPRT